MSAVTNNLSINVEQPTAEVPSRGIESALDREQLIPQSSAEGENRPQGCSKRRAAAAVLAIGSLAPFLIAATHDVSRSTRFWCTLSQWSGFATACALGAPTAIQSRCHAASVIARRVIGTGVAAAGAFAVDAVAQYRGDDKASPFLGLGFFLVGMTVALGPEIYRGCRQRRN